MSPEKATVIFRDGGYPISSVIPTEEEKLESQKNVEKAYFDILGIKLNLEKVTYVDLY